MRKISQIIESRKIQKHGILLEDIMTVSQLMEFSHNKLKASNSYSPEKAEALVENLLGTYPDNLKKCAEEIENFLNHG